MGCALTHEPFQSSGRLLLRYRSGLMNQMISRVESQTSRTPRTIQTSDSRTSLQRTTAGTRCPQYAVLIEGQRATDNGQSSTAVPTAGGAWPSAIGRGPTDLRAVET
jgi:hypothetical protein